MSLTRHAAQAQGRYPRVPPRRRVTRERLLEQLHLDVAKVDRAARVLQQFGRLPLSIAVLR